MQEQHRRASTLLLILHSNGIDDGFHALITSSLLRMKVYLIRRDAEVDAILLRLRVLRFAFLVYPEDLVGKNDVVHFPIVIVDIPRMRMSLIDVLAQSFRYLFHARPLDLHRMQRPLF